MLRGLPSRWNCPVSARREIFGADAVRGFTGHLVRWLALGSAVLGLASAVRAADEVAPTVRGFPLTRFYSYEEIGNASRGSALAFDNYGRVAVMRGGSFCVLNDATWVDLAEKDNGRVAMQRVLFTPDGRGYYGGLGSWGLVEMAPSGLLRAHPLVPGTYPKWITAASFNDVIATEQGVYFGSFNGVVYWDRGSGAQQFFELPGLSRIFAAGNEVFASSVNAGIYLVDTRTGALRPITDSGLGDAPIDQTTTFGPDRALVATRGGQLLVFDGKHFTPWPAALGETRSGRVSALRQLVDGHVAVAVNGRGLFLFTEQGEIVSALTTPEYHRVTDLAAREIGVLWVANESGIEKVFYESPLTSFGQRLGLPVSWPQVVRWRDRVVIASSGRVYEAAPETSGETTHFQIVPDQPHEEVWAIAARDDRMLIGAQQSVYSRNPDGGFSLVLQGIDAGRLVMVDDGLCYVIGTAEIGVLRWADGRWSECAPRVPGLGYPAVVHGTKKAAWVELGTNRAARIELKDRQLHVQVFENFPWTERRWVNIGMIGDKVLLTGLPDGTIFYDETRGKIVAAPELENLLRETPRRIARMQEDESGTIWAAYESGLFKIVRHDGKFRVESTSFGKISERFPIVQLLPGGDVWLTTGQSLYHVDRRYGRSLRPSARLALVSVLDGRTNDEYLGENYRPGAPLALNYAQNSLILRFFTGTYAFRQNPSYKFTLHRGPQSWLAVGNGSLLTLTDLREGDYRLEVELNDGDEPAGEPLWFDFTIAPPWFRTGYAYALYFVLGTGLILGLMRWSVHRARQRTAVLENVIEERTNELRAAMQQLNEETRHAATLAERGRLAGEIHDSLQQGLSGLMLHLDATLKLPDLPGAVRSRLNVARNMVSFTRHEVQHAVWDMETPLLEGTELDEALRKISALIGAGGARVQIEVTGQPVKLASSKKHHLLRIAQEAITNAVRHAAATTITIALHYDPGFVALSVTDDGNGFVPSDVLASGIGHFGLRGLRGRAAKIGGEVQIESSPGHGTAVRVTVQATEAEVHSHAH